jgi:hypothetical protein
MKRRDSCHFDDYRLVYDLFDSLKLPEVESAPKKSGYPELNVLSHESENIETGINALRINYLKSCKVWRQTNSNRLFQLL